MGAAGRSVVLQQLFYLILQSFGASWQALPTAEQKAFSCASACISGCQRVLLKIWLGRDIQVNPACFCNNVTVGSSPALQALDCRSAFSVATINSPTYMCRNLKDDSRAQG